MSKVSSADYLLSELRTERALQDSRWGGPEHDDRHSPEEWAVILLRQLGLALGETAPCSLQHSGYDPERWRRKMLAVAAVALAALESHDRRHGRMAGSEATGSGF